MLDSILIHFPVRRIPNRLFENRTRLLSESIIVLVEVNPTKAPISMRNSPENEKGVKITPTTNSVMPAMVPIGPNDWSSLLFCITF